MLGPDRFQIQCTQTSCRVPKLTPENHMRFREAILKGIELQQQQGIIVRVEHVYVI